jgi:hypothetical protein
MKACCPDCRVLLFSGQADTFDMLEAARTDGHKFDLLSKPVFPGALLIKIRSLIDGSSPLSNALAF